MIFPVSPTFALAAAVFVSSVSGTPNKQIRKRDVTSQCQKLIDTNYDGIPKQCAYDYYNVLYNTARPYADEYKDWNLPCGPILNVIKKHPKECLEMYLAKLDEDYPPPRDESIDKDCQELVDNEFEGIPKVCAFKYYNKREREERTYAKNYNDYSGSCDEFNEFIEAQPEKCLDIYLAVLDRKNPPLRNEECQWLNFNHFGGAPNKCVYDFYNQREGTNRKFAEEYNDWEGDCGIILNHIAERPDRCLDAYLDKLDKVHPPPQ